PANPVGHLSRQRANRARRGTDAVRRRESLWLRTFWRQGGHRRVHRTALDHHRDRARSLPDLMKTQVCIVGAGPAGLLLGHLLRAEGIECVVLERRTPDYVLSRIRAGVLERITVSLMERLGLDQRLKAEGLVEEGFNLADGERLIRIDIAGLTGHHVVVYGQTELTRDLMDARGDRGLEVVYQADDVALHDIESDTPSVTYRKAGAEHRIEARIVAGCDGFHGPSRQAVLSRGTEYHREYPFGWLGILADVPPCHHELIYSRHERGFALASMRSETRSRYYIDVPLSE